MTEPQDHPNDSAILAFLMRHAMGSAAPHLTSTPEVLEWVRIFVDSNEVANWLLAMVSNLNPDLDVTATVSLAGGLTMPRMSVSGTITVTPPPPYPSDLVKAPPARSSQAQLRTLVIVLVWLLAIIGPVVEQHLSAHTQSLTNTEVGTISMALAFTALMQARK